MPGWDYIIAGGGSAGAVLAARLSEDPDIRVLLLEAGGRDRHPLFHIPAGFAKMTKGMASWGWETVPQKHLGGRRLWYTQAKVIGGGSSINAQLYARGNPRDYDGWGIPGWDWADVLPYFKRSEDNERFENAFHAKGGPLGVSDPKGALPIAEAYIEAAEAIGLPRNPDFNGKVQEGAGYYQLTQRKVRRSSTAQAFLKPALTRANLTLVTHAHVGTLSVENGRVTGLTYTAKDGSHAVHADREVILSAGAIGSPTLLLRSGRAGHRRPPRSARRRAKPPGSRQSLHDLGMLRPVQL